METKNAAQAPSYKPVNARPVKAFFVTMLTRDIALSDAILDLLDNCVDGILRTEHRAAESFSGYHAEIDFDEDHFAISDNCGGIPLDLHKYAFRLGRDPTEPPNDLPMVGIYGIGMKRAIFKMGQHCLISTIHEKNSYEFEIAPTWIANEEDWDIPVRQGDPPKAGRRGGTTIVVGNLYDGIARTFGEEGKAFKNELYRRIAEQYAFIIAKGFKITLNGEDVVPRPTKLVFTQSASKKHYGIAPYIFQTKIDGVSVFLAIGLTRALPTTDEIEKEDDSAETRYSSLGAGWTIVCNDRAVVYCDRTELTGWGEAEVPRYHTQFIAISGIVEFRSEDASQLPTTTTKRGIDASSRIYLQVKNKMREGLLQFVKYAYAWRGKEAEAKKLVDEGEALSFAEVKQRATALPMRKVARFEGGVQYKPDLPRPKEQESDLKTISFKRKRADIRAVGKYLLDDAEKEPKDVGAECFDRMLAEARR